MTLPEKIAEAVVANVAKRKGLERLGSDRPWLDFIQQLVLQLLPVLIGCFGVSGAAAEIRRPGLLTKVRLRLGIRRELGDAESIDLLAGPLFDAMIEAGKVVSEGDVAEFAGNMSLSGEAGAAPTAP